MDTSVSSPPSMMKHNFANFLLSNNLLNLILAVYLGNVLQGFFTSIVEGAVMPLFMKFVPDSKYTNFKDIQIKVHGIDIMFGDIVMNIIKLFVGFLLTYLIVKYVIFKYLKN